MVKGRLCETLREAKKLLLKLNGPYHDSNKIFTRKRFHPRSKYKYWVGDDLEHINGWYGA